VSRAIEHRDTTHSSQHPWAVGHQQMLVYTGAVSAFGCPAVVHHLPLPSAGDCDGRGGLLA